MKKESFWKKALGIAILLALAGMGIGVQGQSISGGNQHALVICNDGTVQAWGENVAGQLGNGTMINSTTPIGVVGMTNAVAVAAGLSHSLALHSNGTVWAWGGNWFGQLGIGNTLSQTTPVQVSGLTNIVAIATRGHHALGLRNDGTVWAWGRNRNGQLGDSTILDRHVPVQVHQLTGVVAIAAGDSHSLALKSNGEVWAWGQNAFGQLGTGNNVNFTLPVRVNGLTNIVQIASGGRHSLALEQNGTVWAWGFNAYGQLGNGGGPTLVPVSVVGLSTPQSIAAGFGHSMALMNDGTVYAWGVGGWGSLGNDGTTNQPLPVLADGLTGITEVAGGGLQSLARQQGGTVWTWGQNNLGQLGNGNSDNFPHPRPARIGGLCIQYSAVPDSVFTNYFRTPTVGINHWVAGELQSALNLQNGNYMWLLGRSHINSLAPDNTIPCDSEEVDNCFLLQDTSLSGPLVTFLDNGVNKSFFKLSPTDSTTLIPGHGYVKDDEAHIFLSRWDSNHVFLGNYEARIGIGTITLLDITRTFPNDSIIDFGKAVIVDSTNGLVYAYGSRVDSLGMRRPYVARRDFATQTATWFYFTGLAWDSLVTNARPISIFEVSENFSVSALDGRYYITTHEWLPSPLTCGLQRNIVAYGSDSLQGPFEFPHILYTTPDSFGGIPLQTFGGYALPFFNRCDSMLVFYDVNDQADSIAPNICPSQCARTGRQDADTWRPKFIRVPYPLYDTTIAALVGTFTSTVNGMTWVFTPTNSQGGTYHWDFGDGSSSNSMIGVHQFASSGTYTVTLTIDGCSFAEPILGMDEAQGPLGRVVVFPNPSQGHIQLHGSDLGNGAVHIEVTTVVGQVLFRESHRLIGGELDAQIELSVAPGIYFLSIGKGEMITVRKVVIQ
ncbi:MAG: PKD domain-containing protein [Bacteroidia bacterium]